MKLDQLTDIVLGKNVMENFAKFDGTGPIFMPFLLYHSTAINQKPITMALCFFTLLNVRRSKITNIY